MNRYLFLIVFSIFFFQVNAQEPNDCINAITVCGNGNFSSNATGYGNDYEITSCGGNEHNSLWLEVNIVQSGTLGFDLIPTDPDIMVDYDFWVFGPNSVCSNLQNPIRCSTTNPNAAGLANNHTGINGSTTLTQTGPGPNGNGYVYWLNVNAGESYYIVVDRPEGDGGFQIEWTGTAMDGTGAFPTPPEPNEIDDQIACSNSVIGGVPTGVFPLISLSSSISNDLANETVEYYANLADATDGVNPLPIIYSNTSNPQTIYAKVISGSDCYSLIDFDLIVSEIPEATLSASSNALCEDEDVTFTISGSPNTTVFYNIDGGTSEQILLDASGIGTITESPSDDFVLTLEEAQILNDSGVLICSNILSDSESITVSSNSTPTIVNNTPICEGEDGELEFSGDPNATITYTIDGGANQTFDLDASGDYTLTLPGLLADTEVEIISVTNPLPPNCVLALNITETIVVNPSPTVIAPSPLLICNDGVNPNSAEFNLELESAEISNNEPNVSVTYYETQVLAEAGNPLTALVSPYDSTSANQTIYVRVETDLGCVDYTTLNLEVVGAPIANTVPALQSCDANSQGFGTFDLTQAEADIIAGNTQPVEVSYYISQAEAEAGTPEISDPTVFQNTSAYNQTIHVRVDTDGTDCYNISSLNLEVFDTPIMNTLPPFEMCDDAVNDGFTQFDLESQTPLLLGGTIDVTVSYHDTMSNAEDGIDELPNLYTNTSSSQTIYIRAENNFNIDCYEITTLTLEVNPLPVLVNPTPLEVCDDGTPDGSTEIDLSVKNVEITGSNPNYSINYYLDLNDAESETNPLPILYTNIFSGQIIVARVNDINTGCYSTTDLELIVAQAPVANSPTALEYCDPDSDGFGVFDLASKDNEITGGDATLTVSYHETMADADNNVNAVTSPYDNIVLNSQILYARVESSTILTDCDSIVPLELIVNPTPQLGTTAPEPFEVCDDISADGYAQFDLTSKRVEILQSLADSTLYTVTFYTDETNADLALNPILNLVSYTNTTAFNQTLWIRVEDNVSGCYKLTTLELIVNSIPVLVQAEPLILCDDNNPGDEVEEFTLEDASGEILNGQSGISLAFFETQNDVDTNNPIVGSYANISNPQTVIVVGTNVTTRCTNTSLLTLRVSPIPSPTTPTDLEVCDDDTDGFASFNLEDRTVEIIGNELNIAITYHETLADANSGINTFVSPYTNIVTNEQTLYVRATNTITGCYNTSKTLTIRVLETPQILTSITDFVNCDSDSNGITQFNLTTKDSEIIGSHTNVTLTYHISEADALTGNNPISNTGNYTNSINPQIIYVRLENDNSDCFDTGSFEISVSLPPEAIQPTPLEICDDEVADGITLFDLTIKNDEITGGEASWSVNYYETLENAQDEIDAVDAEAYTNAAIGIVEANPQTLFAVVTDTDTGCSDMVTLTIRVMPNPTPTNVMPDLVLCDNNNTGDEIELFDLTINETLLFNGEANVSATYYESYNNAEDDFAAIPDPTQYSNLSTSQVIYVRVSNDITGCFTIGNFTLILNTLPTAVPVTDFIQCELFTDGFDSFDLTTKDEEILGGQDATEFTVSYHENLLDAEVGTNDLIGLYTNTSNPQQIFVTITNNTTGCSISSQSFYIEVHEAAQANSDTNPILYEVCDDDIDGDYTNGSAQFDLTTIDIEVLDTQDPSNYIVTYYATQYDADLKENPLPTLYENTVNPQVIYARVDNDTPDATTGNDSSICYAVAELTLQVNSLPDFNLEDSYILCINTNDTEVLEPLVLDTYLSSTDYNFVWYFNNVEIVGETQSSIIPLEEGTYSVDVTDIFTSAKTNCVSTDSTEVIESEPPSITIELLTQAFADNHVLEATAIGIGIYEYSLDGGPWQDSGIFSNVSSGDHEITARDRNGCGLRSTSKFVLDYPLYFTPNGDGNNDTWNIEGIGDSAVIYIYDRYGKLLQQLNPDGDGWDGTYNGKVMPTDGYWFIVEYDEQSTGVRREFKAHFSLKR